MYNRAQPSNNPRRNTAHHSAPAAHTVGEAAIASSSIQASATLHGHLQSLLHKRQQLQAELQRRQRLLGIPIGFDSQHEYVDACHRAQLRCHIFSNITGVDTNTAKRYLSHGRRPDDAYCDLLWNIRCGAQANTLAHQHQPTTQTVSPQQQPATTSTPHKLALSNKSTAHNDKPSQLKLGSVRKQLQATITLRVLVRQATLRHTARTAINTWTRNTNSRYLASLQTSPPSAEELS